MIIRSRSKISTGSLTTPAVDANRYDYKVNSKSTPGIKYDVVIVDTGAKIVSTCTCLHFVKKLLNTGKTCKHIDEVLADQHSKAKAKAKRAGAQTYSVHGGPTIPSVPISAKQTGTLDEMDDAAMERELARARQRLEQIKAEKEQRKPKLYLDATRKQQVVLNCGARITITVASRRFGKTTMGCLKIITAVSKAAPQPEATIWWVAPTYNQARKPFRMLARALRDAGLIGKNGIHRGELSLETLTGWIIEFKSAQNEDGLLGAGLHGMVIDEWGILPDTLWYETLRPMLADNDGWVFAIGTPRGKRGWGYAAFVRGQDKQDPTNAQFMSFKFTVEDAVFIPPGEVEEMRRTLPARVFAQEMMAEFLDDGTIFTGVRAKRKAPILGEAEGIGADWAKKTDSTVFTAIGATSGCIRAIMRLPHRIPYPDQVEFLIAFCEKRKAAGAGSLYLVHDQTGVGEAVDDLLLKARTRLPLLRRMVKDDDPGFEGLIFTNASKTELVEEAMAAWENNELGWRTGELNDTESIAILEHESFSAEYSPGGRVSYGAPEGLHDDCVISVCLANRARRKLFRNRGRFTPKITTY